MKNKSPFDRFFEESERIRKISPTDEQIKKINELSREVEKEGFREGRIAMPKNKTLGRVELVNLVKLLFSHCV